MSGAKKKSERQEALAQMGLTEKQKQDLKAKQAAKRNTILGIVGGVVAVVLVVALLVWHSGVIARNTVALTVKDHDFTVADVDFYYTTVKNNAISNDQAMADYAQQLGVEYTSSIDPQGDMRTQYVDADHTQSYHDYFLETAQDNMVEIAALYDAAKAEGYTLSQEAQTQLDESLSAMDDTVRQYSFGSRSAYLKAVYGRNMTEKVYLRNLEMNTLASDYFSHSTETMKNFSDEDLKAYYDENPAALDSYDYIYAYFDGNVATTDAEGNEVAVTDEQKTEAMAAAKQQAEDLMAAVKAADAETPAEGQSKKDFSAVAAEQGVSATPRVSVIGTSFSSMPYNEWLLDDARQDGDMEVFEQESGYYLVQFHARALYDEPTVDVRHILFSTAMEDDPATEDVNEALNPTQAHIDEVKATAEATLEEFNAGEKTAEAFGALADERSEDGRDQSTGELNAKGGLYSGVRKGQMVAPFEDWCFSPMRDPGETGIVQTDYGFHVMYFQAYHRPEWMDAAESAKSSAEQNAWMEGVKEGYEAVPHSAMDQVGG